MSTGFVGKVAVRSYQESWEKPGWPVRLPRMDVEVNENGIFLKSLDDVQSMSLPDTS